MKPIKFKEMTATLAEDQPEYLPLPVARNDTVTISCWQFTWWERVLVLFGYPMWLMQLNYGDPLQPQLPRLDYPFEIQKEVPK